MWLYTSLFPKLWVNHIKYAKTIRHTHTQCHECIHVSRFLLQLLPCVHKKSSSEIEHNWCCEHSHNLLRIRYIMKHHRQQHYRHRHHYRPHHIVPQLFIAHPFTFFYLCRSILSSCCNQLKSHIRHHLSKAFYRYFIEVINQRYIACCQVHIAQLHSLLLTQHLFDASCTSRALHTHHGIHCFYCISCIIHLLQFLTLLFSTNITQLHNIRHCPNSFLFIFL